MARFPQKILTANKALHQLGIKSIANYSCHRLGLRSGFYRQATPQAEAYGPFKLTKPVDPIFIPSRGQLNSILQEAERGQALKEAEEIVSGRVRLFGGKLVPLNLKPPGPLTHWTEYEIGGHDLGVEDIKFIWEPARFGWAFTLGRAYILSGDEKYSRAFWLQAETFLHENPPNLGPNWISAQEAALRLIAFAFSLKAFAGSPESTPVRVDLLAGAIAAHAERIPPTIAYAKAQNNNHLLTEAAGLYTAGSILSDHPAANKWRRLGWKWFNQGISIQIDDAGGYVQHSVNYHRLMLQTALWMHMLVKSNNQPENLTFPEKNNKKIANAVQWLLQLVDKETGEAPNLGPNDGAYIIPLTGRPFSDHRPVLQAASLAFLEINGFQEGEWDEMAVWFNCRPETIKEPGSKIEANLSRTPHTLHSPSRSSWAYLRAATFSSRPGHADQLHLDLWWRGINVALDPGTYLYNASQPWENSLIHTEVHNTITIDGHDQMKRAGRFLWLDWAQARVLTAKTGAEESCLSADHSGYIRKGILHRREVSAAADGSWRITDHLLDTAKDVDRRKIHLFRLHWLLPDWPWELEKPALIKSQPDEIVSHSFQIKSPFGWVKLIIEAGNSTQNEPAAILLARAGETLSGEGRAAPNWGWYSPTYAHKVPALSLAITGRASAPYRFVTRWIFPDTSDSG